jgi:serine/threonine protein phosphatase PrpC
MKIASFALSDVGRVRRENQDSSGHFPDRNLFVVADGMGGHQGGKQASEMAVATISERLTNDVDGGVLAERTERLVEAVRDANRRIVERGARESDLNRMGTTLVALLLQQDEAAIVHVGDSRAYRWRDGQLAVDHRSHAGGGSPARQRDLEAEASTHPYRHVLTCARRCGRRRGGRELHRRAAGRCLPALQRRRLRIRRVRDQGDRQRSPQR